jgi:hypothetical protein
MQGRSADASGLLLSGLCLLHCLAFPLLAGAVPLLEILSEDWRAHLVLLILIFPAAWLAFGKAWMQGERLWPLPGLAAFGVMLLAVALFIPHELEIGFSVAGGLCLAVAHILNIWKHPSHARRVGRA